MALSIAHLARWLAWQFAEPEPEPERPASITVFSSPAEPFELPEP